MALNSLIYSTVAGSFYGMTLVPALGLIQGALVGASFYSAYRAVDAGFEAIIHKTGDAFDTHAKDLMNIASKALACIPAYYSTKFIVSSLGISNAILPTASSAIGFAIVTTGSIVAIGVASFLVFYGLLLALAFGVRILSQIQNLISSS